MLCKKVFFLVSLSSLAALIACSHLDSRHSPLNWGQCPDYLEADEALECSTVQMPLDHTDHSPRSIDVLIMRTEGASQDKKGQVWFLMGGPGESIATFAYPLKVWSETYPQWDYYTVEHRGTGASTPLSCPFMEDSSAQCADYLLQRWGRAGLAGFNPTQAAYDVATFMSRVGQNGKRFLYGVSYGTYLVQRFTTMFPAMLDGIILDGVVPAGPDEGLYAIDRYDQNANDLVLEIMQRCDDAPVCSNRMKVYGKDSLDVLAGTFDQIDNDGLCGQLNPEINRTSMRQQLAALASNWWGCMLVPALLYRINRCSAEDVRIIKSMFSEDEPEEEYAAYPHFSYNLNTNIIISELIGGTTIGETRAFSDIAYASPDETLAQYTARDVTGWPVYSPDQYVHQWPDTDMPVLILNGDMDPQTPVEGARFAREHYNGANQYLVEFPTAVHGILPLTLLPGIALNAVDTCGSRIFFEFLDDPDTVPNTSCTGSLIQPDFSGATEHARDAAQKYFETEKVWD